MDYNILKKKNTKKRPFFSIFTGEPCRSTNVDQNGFSKKGRNRLCKKRKSLKKLGIAF